MSESSIAEGSGIVIVRELAGAMPSSARTSAATPRSGASAMRAVILAPHPMAPRSTIILVLLVFASSAGAQDDDAGKPKPDKNGYTLWNRTPDDLMRPLSTDRPDTTDTPLTVDAGHVQLEMDFLSYTYDRVRA